MVAKHRSAGVLFWCMTAAAFAILLPCVLLPAWLEYRQAAAQRAARLERLERLNATLAAQAREIEHLHHDQAYNERILREELGLETPGVATIYVERSGGASGGASDAGPAGATVAPSGRGAPRGGAASGSGRSDVGDGAAPAGSASGGQVLEPLRVLSTAAETAIARYPGWAQVFVDPRARTILTGAALGLLLAAIVLLGGRGARRAGGVG